MQYGSNQFKPVIVAKSSVGRIEQKSKISVTPFLRIFVAILEIGFSLIPGVGPGALVGIGLGAGIINTAISATEGSVNAVGLLFDFGAPLVAGGTAFRNVSRFTRVIEETEPFQKAAVQNIKTIKYAKADKDLMKLRRTADYWGKRSIAAEKKAAGFAKRWLKNDLTDSQRTILDYVEYRAREDVKKFAAKKSYVLRKLVKKYNTTVEAVEKEMAELTEAFETIKNFKSAQKLNKSRFASEINKAAPEGKEKLVRDIFLPRRKEAVELSAKKLKAQQVFENAISGMSKDGKKLTEQVMSNVRYIHKTKKQTDQIVRLLFKKLSKRDAGIFHANIDGIFESSEELFAVFATQSDAIKRKAWIKYLGSRRFNDKIVQKLQLIDPNDLGRAIPEALYKKFKRKIERRFEKVTWKIANKKVRDLLLRTNKLMEAWEKSGGVRFPRNRYIIGIKEIVKEGPRILVLVKFNKLTTAAKKHGKNLGGKKDIMVVMSHREFHKLTTDGVRYWNRVAVRKGWAVSRGGRRARISASTVSNELSLFLGFVPIPALRNLLSITSNWVENTASLSKGKYFKDYIAKLERAFVRTSINRSARLATRVATGGILKRSGKRGVITKMAGRQSEFGGKVAYEKALMKAINKSRNSAEFVGRELQRAATITLGTFEGKDANGYFKLKKGGTRSKSAGRVISEKFLLQGMPTTVKSVLIKKSTKKKRTGGRMLLGSRRKAGQVGRVYSAVTPSGVKPLRNLLKFK